jgi:flavin-binding protein dodecin
MRAVLVAARSSHYTCASTREEPPMSEHTYKLVEIVGSSPQGVDTAIKNAIERASKTLKHLDWFEVSEIRGHITDGKVAHFQVKLKVGFRLE